MLKLMRFVNDRGAVAEVPTVHAGATEYSGLKEVFESILAHETRVTECINNVVDLCLQAKDYTTHNFMQWYVSEQIEEEGLARKILDKLALAGDDPAPFLPDLFPARALFSADDAGDVGEPPPLGVCLFALPPRMDASSASSWSTNEPLPSSWLYSLRMRATSLAHSGL